MEQIIGNKESCTTIFQLIFKSNKLKKFRAEGETNAVHCQERKENPQLVKDFI